MKQKPLRDDFFYRVYQVVKQIPYGKITSYGAIARYLGLEKSARVVGWALTHSKSSQQDIPAHRVVNRVGLLTGKKHFQGTNLMQQLLESEGLIIKDNQIVNFKESFWDPNTELLN